MPENTPVVRVTHQQRVAVITIDYPPVNALSQAVRAGLMQAVTALAQDPEADAAVIACAGNTFVAGADITEFGKPPQDPRLKAVIAAIEDSPKPIAAALHGTVLGGGLELALGCHWRVAVPQCKLGLPEVNLGIIPGAGGTQRLPRLVGVERAIEMVTSGKPIGAPEALEAGLVDALMEGDLTSAAVQFCRQRLAAGTQPVRVRDRDDLLAAARAQPGLFTKAREAAAKKARGQRAPVAAVDAIEAAVQLPFDEGLERERQIVTELMQSDQSRALRYFFFAERESGKLPGITTGGIAPVQRAAVIGAGTMGGGIAMSLANAGITVRLVDADAAALERGLGLIRKNYEATARRGGMTAQDVEDRMGRIRPSLQIADVADAEVVIEAVFENTALKKRVFAELDRHAAPDAVLGTNTSTLDIDDIATATQRPQSVIGLHFFSPANVMKLLEVVRTGKTSDAVVARAMALGRQMRKVPVLVGTCDGFVGNRILRARSKQAEQIVLHGALPQQVDKVLQDFGFPMGVFAMGDMAGLDIGWRIRQERGQTSLVADKLCEMGRLGQKTGAGYFRYDPQNPAGARTPIPDPVVEEIVLEASRTLGITRKPLDDELILQRLLYPMVNEAAKILEEGVARRASDIDVIWIYGYGWPRHRGGPMHFADAVGLEQICGRLQDFEREYGESFRPAPLLQRLAERKSSFAEWQRETAAAA